MAGTFTNLLLHIVFSTKHRAPLITLDLRLRLYDQTRNCAIMPLTTSGSPMSLSFLGIVAATTVGTLLMLSCDRPAPKGTSTPTAQVPMSTAGPVSSSASLPPNASNTAGVVETPPFSYEAPAPLQVVVTKPKTVVLAPGGRVSGVSGTQLILTRSSKVFTAAAKPRGPETFLRELDDFKSIGIVQQTKIDAGPLSGFEATTTGIVSPEGMAVELYCAQIYGSDGTITALGIASPTDKEEMFKVFRKVVESVRLQPSGRSP